MTANLFHAGNPALPSPELGFDALAHDVQAEAEAIREQSGEADHALTIPENYQVFRVASQGILGILRHEGLEEADTLLEELEKEALANPYADLIAVSSTYYNESRESDDDEIQREKEELSQLARIVGDAAHAAVVVAMGQTQDVSPLLLNARQGVLDYDMRGSIAGDTLHAFLDEVEVGVPALPDQPLAA